MLPNTPPQGAERGAADREAVSEENAITVASLHKRIGTVLVEIDRWETRNGPYDQRKDDNRLDLKLKTLIATLCRTPATTEAEVMEKLERAIHVGGRGTRTGDTLIEGALEDLRRIRIASK